MDCAWFELVKSCVTGLFFLVLLCLLGIGLKYLIDNT